MASLPRRRTTTEIRECANLIKVRVNDIVLFALVLGVVIMPTGDESVALPTVDRVRLW